MILTERADNPLSIVNDGYIHLKLADSGWRGLWNILYLAWELRKVKP